MSKYYFVKQSSYKNKLGNSGLLTLLVDEKGNSVVSTSCAIIDPKYAPVLPEVNVTVEAGSSFNGRISSKVTGISFVDQPR
jgi:hypothetical protein